MMIASSISRRPTTGSGLSPHQAGPTRTGRNFLRGEPANALWESRSDPAHDQLLRAFEDLQEKERLLAAYGDIARLASSSLEIDEIIDKCRSIIRLLDDSLLLAVDWNKTESIRGVSERWYAHRGLPWNWNFDPISGHNAEALLYRSFDNGLTWTGPESTGCLTTSLNVRQISDGTLFLSGTHFRCEGLSEDQVFFRSTDNGRTWSDPILMSPISSPRRSWKSYSSISTTFAT